MPARSNAVISKLYERVNGVDTTLAKLAPVTNGWRVAAPVRDSIVSGVYGAQNPCAEYDAVSNTTYLAYFDGKSFWITGFRHAQRDWIPRVKIEDRPAAVTVDDGHIYPSMTIDANGRIHVLYGAHSTDWHYARSTNPRDITSWNVSTLSGGGAWPGSYGSICFEPTSNAVWWGHRVGSAHNKTAGSMTHEIGKLARRALDGSSHVEYTVVDLKDIPDAAADFYVQDVDALPSKVYFTFFVAHGAGHDGTRSDVYCAYLNTTDLTIRAVDGTILTSPVSGVVTPLTYTSIQNVKVRAYQHDWVSGLKHNIEPDGTVLITVNEYIPGETRCGYRVCRYKPGASGAVWQTADVGPTARSTTIYNCPSIRKEEDGTYILLAPTGRVGEPGWYNTSGGPAGWNPNWGGDLTLYRSADGLTWTRDRILASTRDGGGAAGITSVQIPRNSAPALKAVASPGGGSVEAVHPIFTLSDDPAAPEGRWAGGVWEHIAGIGLTAPVAGVPLGGGALAIDDVNWVTLDLSTVIPPNADEILVQGFVTADGSTSWTNIGFLVRAYDTNNRNQFTGDARFQGFRTAAFGEGGVVQQLPVGRDKRIEYKTFNMAALSSKSVGMSVVGWRLR